MNLNELDKMRRNWPKETAKIIGAQRQKRSHYGHAYPVRSIFSRITCAARQQAIDNWIGLATIAGVLGFAAMVMVAFWVMFPAAVDQLVDQSRSVVAESRGIK